jgi:PKD repeat protein
MYQAVLVARDPIKDMVEDIESLEVEIDAYQPQIVLVNPSVDFQNCFVGVNTERNIVIANSGYASLELSNIQVTGTGFSSTARELLQSQFSSALRHRNISIPAGQSEAIPVILNAVSEGEIIGNLSFNTNDLTSPTVNIPLYATASYPPEISFNPLNISKSVYLGMSDVDSLLITNNGQGDLHIYDIYKNNAAWLQLLQSSMTIPAGTSDYLNYAVSAGTLGDGHYIGQVTFLTNVPDNETVNIQAHLEVVDRPVIASFSVDVPQGYAPLAVQFTDTSSTVDGSTITGWAWDFESDGSIDSSEQNPSHIFSTKGSYDVTLTVTNNNNISNTAIIEDCIEVLNTPPVLISNIPDQEIVINSVNNELNLNNYFTDVDNDPLLYYASGYSHCSVLIQNGFVTVTTGAWQGIDRIIFTARDNSNAIVRDTISVRIRPVNEPPVLDLPASITFLMNTSEVVDFAGYISDSDQTDDELTLSFTDNIHTHFSVLGTVVTISVDPDWSGSEAVTVNLDDNQGGEATTGTLLIEVLDSLNPVFEVDNMAPWGGEAIHFTDYTEGNVAVWEWDFESDNTIDSYFQNPTHTYNISGDYYVTLTVRAEPGGTPYSYTMTDPIIVNGTGIPGGDIIDETWTPASSPYNVFGQITVPTTGRLEIQQDVVVNVFTDSMFIIQGELIANQAVFATEMPSNWGGLRFLSGSDDSNLDGCHLFNAENPIQIDGASPNLDGITITAEAIRTTSSGTAIMITGDASPIITNLSVSGYASGLEISGTDAGNPFLQNISFLNSGTPRTVDGAGVVISSSATIDSLTVEDYPTGILFENTTQTPTLTNVRVRNSDNTVRTLDYGVTMSGTVSVDISGLTIEGYTTGIDMNNELGSAATPTLTNVRIRNTDNTTRPDSRGITVSGNVDGTLTDVEINDFAIAVAYEQTGVSETTPTLTNVRVVNSTNTTRLVGEGFLFVGSVACQLSDIEIENCSSGIEIMNNQRTVSTPTLTNVRVRNSENTARPDSKGIYITGSVGPTLDDVDVENMGVGIEFDQMDSGTTTPTLTNVRVRNTDNTVRTAVTGIKVTQSSTVSMTDTEVNDYPQGIEFQNDSTSTMITPTLTNVRVRNTDNTVRQRPLRELDETVYAVKAVGKICLNVDDFQAENTGNGIIYEQQGTLGTSVPSLTNVRVRNSENTTRPNAYGLFLKNIPLISCSNDTLSGIDYGLVYQNLSNERANPVLTNVRIRNSENATRLIGVGVELGNNIDAIIRGCEITGFNTGIRVLGNNNSEIVSNDLFNNAIGMELSSTLGTIEKNAIVATANMAPQMITALSVVNNAALDVSKFTIDNYPRAVEATNCSVQLTNSIIWGQSTIVQPYLSTNAIISSAYCNTYTDAPVAGVGNINSEPMFVDAANGDYRLNFESPMIDAGDPDADGDGWSYYEGDMDDADPDGTRLDMGSKYYRHYAHIVINDQTIIQGEPSSYHADTYGHIPQLVTYDWDFGDNSTSTDADVIHTYALPGVYSVRLIVTSGALVDTVYHENHVLVSQTLLPAPTNVGISASGNDITITWLPVLNDYYGNPVSVNHYLVYWSDSYDGDFYYLGDSGIIPSFTDVGVLHRVKYYRVIGFIGDLRSLNEYLTRTRGVLPKPNGISSQKSRLKRSKN